MIWSTARIVEHSRLALLRLLLGLFATAGMMPDGEAVSVLPRSVRNAILLVLRPAESALRRLIYVEARKLKVAEEESAASRTQSDRKKSARNGSNQKGSSQNAPGNKRGTRPPKFRLIDPRKFIEELHPHRRKTKAKLKPSTEPQLQVRVAGFDGQPDFVIWSEPKAVPEPDDMVSAVRLIRRMLALKLALEDIPAQALRMAREMAKRAKAPPGPGRVPPLRGGTPPGHRKQQVHEVDELLETCHWLATCREPADTS